ncbi:hypothetical protein BC833DRAFT_624410 [Globomyces pollinis-pini]|nr:hypothetical protein BC833DRAFT_624410 [Globomyces pollinis-pini]KAJ2990859.1 hypothetical protein HDV02_004120 [Globomyces sp. JEL0801]
MATSRFVGSVASLQKLRETAETGDPMANYQLGLYYEIGCDDANGNVLIVGGDYLNALKCYKTIPNYAMNQNRFYLQSPLSQFRISYIYQISYHNDKLKGKIYMDWLYKSFCQGYAIAAMELGEKLLNQDMSPKSKNLSIFLYYLSIFEYGIDRIQVQINQNNIKDNDILNANTLNMTLKMDNAKPIMKSFHNLFINDQFSDSENETSSQITIDSQYQMNQDTDTSLFNKESMILITNGYTVLKMKSQQKILKYLTDDRHLVNNFKNCIAPNIPFAKNIGTEFYHYYLLSNWKYGEPELKSIQFLQMSSAYFCSDGSYEYARQLQFYANQSWCDFDEDTRKIHYISFYWDAARKGHILALLALADCIQNDEKALACRKLAFYYLGKDITLENQIKNLFSIAKPKLPRLTNVNEFLDFEKKKFKAHWFGKQQPRKNQMNILLSWCCCIP